jgi:hypothetical protein
VTSVPDPLAPQGDHADADAGNRGIGIIGPMMTRPTEGIFGASGVIHRIRRFGMLRGMEHVETPPILGHRARRRLEASQT